VSDSDFPSGPWLGFYTYHGGRRKFRTDLTLTFKNGRMSGFGIDNVGPFIISGSYDARSKECDWMKTYVGRHNVAYRGFREGKGIWGTWDIRPTDRGGFHIWPLGEAEGERAYQEAEHSEPVEAVS
jgi:hypothetical protein